MKDNIKSSGNKILYFEGAGWFGADSSKASDLRNCRIRTAFHDDAGRPIYLEVYREPNSSKGFIDFCHYISTDKPDFEADDCNKNKVKDECGVCVERQLNRIEYSKSGILEFLSKIGATFGDVETAPELSNYRVFKENSKCDSPACDHYNFGDQFNFDPAIIERAERLKKYVYDIEKSEGKEYPNCSIWADVADQRVYHVLRHFNGYNKQWRVNVADNDFLNVQTWTEEDQTI